MNQEKELNVKREVDSIKISLPSWKVTFVRELIQFMSEHEVIHPKTCIPDLRSTICFTD